MRRNLKFHVTGNSIFGNYKIIKCKLQNANYRLITNKEYEKWIKTELKRVFKGKSTNLENEWITK